MTHLVDILNKKSAFTPPIDPWSAFPLIMLALMFILIAITIIFGRKYLKNQKIFRIVLFTFGLAFLTMELYHEISRYISFNRYDWSSFPFQFCSITMYLSLIIPFINKEKIRKPFIYFLATFSLVSGFLPLFLAQGNLTRWDTLNGVAFSFCWHILIMIVGIASIIHIGIGKSIKKEYKTMLIACGIFASITVIAQLLNVTIHYSTNALENYPLPENGIKEVGYIKDYIFDPDSASLFYISPFFKSNIAIVFDQIWLKAGWYTCWLAYDIAFCLAAFICYFLIYLIKFVYIKIRNKVTNNRAAVEN